MLGLVNFDFGNLSVSRIERLSYWCEWFTVNTLLCTCISEEWTLAVEVSLIKWCMFPLICLVTFNLILGSMYKLWDIYIIEANSNVRDNDRGWQ